MMTKAQYLDPTWNFTTGGNNESAYPKGNMASIDGPGGDQTDGITVTWTDGGGNEHELVGIVYDGGKLVGGPATDSKTNENWNVVIEPLSEDSDTWIKATVSRAPMPGKPPSRETDIAGNWGAEAPPP